MYKTGIRRNLQARHALRGEFGGESLPHGHPYVVEWIVESPVLDQNGFSTDIALMEEVLSEVLGEIDGVFLNDLAYFSTRQTSLENLAACIHDRLAGHPSLRALHHGAGEIRIWESDTAWASYTAAAKL
jgi:6-pyruvoyl-tetrahydropterin synthase